MSDIEDFRPHSVLEHHTLEVVTFQWDGTQAQAQTVAGEIEREMRMRDAKLETARFHVTLRTEPRLTIGITRGSDALYTSVDVLAGEWLAINLHENRYYSHEAVRSHKGEAQFRRARPVVLLHRGISAGVES
jgi:hypothetical protein